MNKYCLICHELYSPTISWQHLLTLKDADPLCRRCRSSFTRIQGSLCDICGRPFDESQHPFRQGSMCSDCLRWQEQSDWKNVLAKNRSVYTYNDFMKEVIALWKFRGDYAIVYTFREAFREEFFRHFDKTFLVVPIPLSGERLHERGFNQAKALAELLHLPVCDFLVRRHLEKQSKKSRRERLQTDNVFQIAQKTPLNGQHIVLIDDIYTTGTTVRHAAKVLLEAGAASVASFTLARG